MCNDCFIHATAEVAENSKIGVGTYIWHQAQVMGSAEVGDHCTLGKGVFIGAGSKIGSLVKLGNYANVFGAKIEDEAFIGPMVCILEDRHPRSTNADGTRKQPGDFVNTPATICRGASIGASSVIMPGVIVGQFAMISAGSVVSKDVPDHAIFVGNPARMVGYACRCGRKLDENLGCECGCQYHLNANGAVIRT